MSVIRTAIRANDSNAQHTTLKFRYHLFIALSPLGLGFRVTRVTTFSLHSGIIHLPPRWLPYQSVNKPCIVRPIIISSVQHTTLITLGDQIRERIYWMTYLRGHLWGIFVMPQLGEGDTSILQCHLAWILLFSQCSRRWERRARDAVTSCQFTAAGARLLGAKETRSGDCAYLLSRLTAHIATAQYNVDYWPTSSGLSWKTKGSTGMTCLSQLLCLWTYQPLWKQESNVK